MAKRSSEGAALLIVLCLCVCGSPAGGQTPSEDAKLLSARATQRIKSLQAEADRLAAQARSVFGDLRKLEIERAIKREELSQADAALAAVTASRADAARRLEALEATRVAETPGVANRLVELAKRGRGGYVKLLLASDDVRAFGRLSRGVAAVAELDRVRLETHRRTLNAERAVVAEIERQRLATVASQKAAASARTALDSAVASRNRLIEELDQRRDLAAQYVSELQAAQLTLERTISSAPSGAPPALPIGPFRGDLDWPIAGQVSAAFGRSTNGRFGTSIVRNGIEIAGPEGTTVRAVHEGTVAYAAPFAGFGILVIVDHGDGAYSLYGHLAETFHAAGARLRRGEAVGTVGLVPTGGAALYFELRIDGRPVDPLQWLRRSR
jgi:septal ring factor EnvC (AmiA/AmiB activator)